MTIMGRSFTSTAIVKRFQTEKIHPSDRIPFSLQFRNHYYVVLENHSGGATRPRKSLMISLSDLIQYRRVTDGQTQGDIKDRAYA